MHHSPAASYAAAGAAADFLRFARFGFRGESSCPSSLSESLRFFANLSKVFFSSRFTESRSFIPASCFCVSDTKSLELSTVPPPRPDYNLPVCNCPNCGERLDDAILAQGDDPVSYTHLTLPTNREV